MPQELTAARSKLYRENPMRALEDLTPGGSEFCGDAAYCYLYIKKKMETLQDQLIAAHKRLNLYQATDDPGVYLLRRAE
jgi:hypothetical protein